MTWVCSDCGTRNKRKERLCIFCGELCEKEPCRFFAGGKLEWDIYSLNGEQTVKLPFFRFGNIMKLVFAAWFISLFIAFGFAAFYDNSLDALNVPGDGFMGRTVDDALPTNIDGDEGVTFSSRLSEMTQRITSVHETGNGLWQPQADQISTALNGYFDDFYEKRIIHYRDTVLHNIDRLRGKD